MNTKPTPEEALKLMHREMVVMSRRYARSEAEREDLYQEACITVVHEALPRYRPISGGTFKAYARVCVKSRLVDLVTSPRFSCGMTNTPGSRRVSGVSLFQPIAGSDDLRLVDALPAPDGIRPDVLVGAVGCVDDVVRAAVDGLCAKSRVPMIGDRIKAIVVHRILSDYPAKMDDLAKRFGVSYQTISNYEAAILTEIWQQLRARGYDLRDMPDGKARVVAKKQTRARLESIRGLVPLIKRDLIRGVRNCEIAKRYGLHHADVTRIASGRRFADVEAAA